MEDLYQIAFIKSKITSDKPVIVDIGANVGYAATFFLSHFPEAQIISFEPLPSNFEFLRKNQELNSAKHWQVIPKAVGKEEGEITLFYQKSKNLTPVASIWQDFEKKNQDSVQVSVTSLAGIFEKHAITQIDLLKIDCEGAEYDILYHTPVEFFSKIRLIAMETHQGNSALETPDELSKFLEKQGYTLQKKGTMLWAWHRL